jgi:BASS family bile acid:Na+ symporter
MGFFVLSFASMNEIDQIALNYNEGGILLMNLSLGFIMFGVALKLTPRDFYLVFTHPKSVLVGFLSQFIALPLITFLIILILKPLPSMALGMILVAACPGGNISNFMTSLSGGNTALSVSMTAIASLLAVFMTPLNIAFWGGLYEPTAILLKSVSISFWEMGKIVGMILVVPMILGMLVRKYRPKIADTLHPITHYGSMLIFAAIVILAFQANFQYFLDYIHLVVLIVLLHNASAILTGLGLAKLFKLPEADQRTLAIETGIQNSGLGLGLIFAFFGGLGGMAIVAGWWGIWHIFSGMTIAYYFRRKSLLTA